MLKPTAVYDDDELRIDSPEMFISLQYGIDVHPAFDDAIDEVHEKLQNAGVGYDSGITLSYCGV